MKISKHWKAEHKDLTQDLPRYNKVKCVLTYLAICLSCRCVRCLCITWSRLVPRRRWERWRSVVRLSRLPWLYLGSKREVRGSPFSLFLSLSLLQTETQTATLFRVYVLYNIVCVTKINGGNPKFVPSVNQSQQRVRRAVLENVW